MAILESGDATGHLQTIEDNKAGRAVVLPRGEGYSVSTITGTMAAALAVNSTVFAMRLNPGSPVAAYITRLAISWATIAAFTVPVTAGRRLSVFRGAGAAASGGTAIANPFKKDSQVANSQFRSTAGGDIRVSTTAALTATGITYEVEEKFVVHLVGSGAAGNTKNADYVGDAAQAWPILLRPGELLAVRNPAAMDAGGTWQMAVDIDWYEK